MYKPFIEIYGAVNSRTRGDMIDLDGVVSAATVERLLNEDITWDGIGLDKADCNFVGRIQDVAFAANTIKELLDLLRYVWEGIRAVKIENVKQGEYLKRKPHANKVYTRSVYDRFAKRYACDDTDDCSREVFLKKGTIVYIGFTY
jgi:hypothetical protein